LNNRQNDLAIIRSNNILRQRGRLKRRTIINNNDIGSSSSGGGGDYSYSDVKKNMHTKNNSAANSPSVICYSVGELVDEDADDDTILTT
jgi:hypothetical protein